MDFRESIRPQTDIAFSLLRHLASSEAKDSNLVFSPLSIQVVLGLIAVGSKGPTQDQILRFLSANSADELRSFSSHLVHLLADRGPIGGPVLSFANGVWVDQSLTLKLSFKEVAEGVFKAGISNVDFQTKAVEVITRVNSWAEKETNGLIREVLPSASVDSTIRLVLANALYFKGVWAEKFDPSSTKEHDFYLQNGSSIKAPFMTSMKKQYAVGFDGFKVLRLPYKQGEDDSRAITLHIFLPDTNDGLPALVEKINSEPGFIERHLPTHKVRLEEFLVPKFKISSGFEASDVLKKHGLVLPFSREGDLTEIVGDSRMGEELYVSKIFHKSFIEVNEEGTEAAAVTAAAIAFGSFVFEEKLEFVADHPFVFVVREDVTGVVLFVGQILNPLA